MWLLDANLDIHLAELLQSLRIDCATAESRGWKALRNGELVSAAVNAGFSTLVTRDRLFAESTLRSGRALFPESRYSESFAAAWAVSPIHPEPGKIVVRP
jgi:hypothetical protein